MVPFAGWEMPRAVRGVIAEHRAVRSIAGIFDVSHMGQIETSGPDALACSSVCCPTTSRASASAVRSKRALSRGRRRLDDLFTYQLAPGQYLTVTNAANHERDLDWFARRPTASTSSCTTAPATTRCSRAGAARARDRPGGRKLSAAERMTVASRIIGGNPALVAGTGYTGEDGVELLLDPDAAPVSGGVDAPRRAPRRPCARDTLRTEVCYHLYGNDLSTERGPIEAGPWLVLQGGHGLHRSGCRARGARDPPPEKLVPFVLTAEGIARPGDAVVGGGVVTSGTFSPSLEVGIGMAYLPPRACR